MAHNWNYGILATPARTIVKTRLKHHLAIDDTGKGVLTIIWELFAMISCTLKHLRTYIRYFKKKLGLKLKLRAL